MTHRESLMDLLSALDRSIGLYRQETQDFQDETKACLFAMDKRIGALETARTDTIFTKMKTWTASLTIAGRLLTAIYKIWLAVSYMAPILMQAWRLIRSYL